MRRISYRALRLGLALMLSGCATVTAPPREVAALTSPAQQLAAQASATALPAVPRLKQKIAIGRFTNETTYGRGLFVDRAGDPLGKQASDMLASKLIEFRRFLVFERPDIGKIEQEQQILGAGRLIGVDTLVLGSVTQFGRSTTGQVGFFSSTKRQVARAKVDIRLVDVRTGLAFFSASGTGEATSELGQVDGFGSRAAYDGTLNDKAIGAAISDVMNTIVQKLAARPWRTDILKVQGNTVFIASGRHQGVAVGDTFAVMRPAGAVRSAQSGFMIDLPPTRIATIRVMQLFGQSETNEGAVAQVVSGTLPRGSVRGLFVTADEGRG